MKNMFQTFRNLSSHSQRVLLVISSVSIVIGAIAVVVGILFERPPDNSDPKWEDIYPFFGVFSYMAMAGGSLLVIANLLSVIAILGWFHVLFIVQILLSVVSGTIGAIGSVIAYLGALLVVVACKETEASCVPCRDNDPHICDDIATAQGKGCYYNGNDFDVLCGDMQNKLVLVGVCLSMGFFLSLVVSTMGCLTCKRMKNTYHPLSAPLDVTLSLSPEEHL